MTKALASQSLSKTCPCGQTKVRLKPTGGAGLIVALPNYKIYEYKCFNN
jgi:hypothetical protein